MLPLLLLRHAKNEELQKSYVTDKKQHLEQEKLRVVRKPVTGCWQCNTVVVE